MSKAQDNIREDLQKERFGLKGEHKRDDHHDSYFMMPVEFKTKHENKGCTTKRRYRNDPFSECVIIATDYKTSMALTDTDWIIFPESLEEWRAEQERKLQSDNGTIPCYDDIQTLKAAIPNPSPEIELILAKIENQVHRNDPAIPKTFFDTDGEYISINQKRIKVKHSDYMIRVPEGVDKAEFFRETMNWYKSQGKTTNAQ